MTAIEFLVEQIRNNKFVTASEQIQVIEQAKEMEKQQIMKAVYDSMGTNFDANMGRAEQYYNKTFKNTNK